MHEAEKAAHHHSVLLPLDQAKQGGKSSRAGLRGGERQQGVGSWVSCEAAGSIACEEKGPPQLRVWSPLTFMPPTICSPSLSSRIATSCFSAAAAAAARLSQSTCAGQEG
jgi:hypothetical protein